MESVDLMMQEHQYILRMLKIIRIACYKIYKHEQFEFTKFNQMIDFVRNYADKHHHSKEENIFFKEINQEIPMAKEPIQGMLIDHNSGRYFIQSLEEALQRVANGDDEANIDVIAYAIAYTDLLTRHIDKEDKAIYIFGEKNLSEGSKKLVDEKCSEVEKNAEDNGLQQKYIDMLTELEYYFNPMRQEVPNPF